MAYEEGLTFNTLSAIATTDLSACQYYALGYAAVTGVDVANSAGVTVATSAKAIAGILQNNPTAGHVAQYAISGVTKAAIAASQVTTAGATYLYAVTGGLLSPTDPGSGVKVAVAMETLASVAQICIITVRLLPTNVVQA